MFAVALAGSIACGSEGVQFRTVLMREWEPPGMSGVRFGAFSFVLANRNGDTIFQSTLEGDGVTSNNDKAVWLEQGNGFVKVAREGEQGPGLAGGANYASFHPAAVNDPGTIRLGGPTSGNGQALFTRAA